MFFTPKQLFFLLIKDKSISIKTRFQVLDVLLQTNTKENES